MGGELVEDLVPHAGGGDGAEFVAGDFDGEVEFAALAYLDDGGGLAVLAMDAGEEVGDQFDGVLRGGEADALRRRGAAGEEVRRGERRFSPQTRASRRSSERARWAPRLSSATAWISSTMTVRTRRRFSRDLPAVSRM